MLDAGVIVVEFACKEVITQPTRYEIVLRGCLGPRLECVLEGFEVVPSERGTTRVLGWVTDQAALQGVLRRVADFGLELVSVREYTET